jgi:hypothetical protein
MYPDEHYDRGLRTAINIAASSVSSCASYTTLLSSDNTASGHGALNLNTAGSNNTPTGVAALLQNTTDFYNTATRVSALYANTGHDNTA